MAQTLKFGNKVWAAKEESVLAYNDINNNYKPLPFSFSRASIGTRVNKDGLIETMGQDIARIDYTDSADGVLLLEPSSTNLATYSEAFDNAYWTKSGSSVVSGFTSPDGTANAFKLVEGTTNSDHSIYATFTSLPSGIYTISAYVKKGERHKCALADRNSGIYVSFDLNNITVIEQGGMIGNIELLSNGWFKLSATTSNALTIIVPQIFILEDSYTTGLPIFQTYTGDGTSGVEIFGAMLEQNSYATSYIPTSGSTVTRAVETCNNSGNSEVFNDSEGVLFANIAALANDQTERQMSIDDGNGINRIVLRYNSVSNNINSYLFNGSVQGGEFNQSLSDITLFLKCAFKYKTNDFSFWVNGFKVGEDINGSTFSDGTLTDLNFDFGGSFNFYGKTKELGYYDTALTDLELETLTSYRNWVSMVNELNLNIIYNG